MNEQIHEQLSALMDGELERDQTRFLLKRMTSGSELPLRWARYHVTRQALRRQHLQPVSVHFADAVMARLEHEPAASSSSRGSHSWLRWGAGGAIAASVAVAALTLTRPVVEEPIAANNARGMTQIASIRTAPAAATSATTQSPANVFQTPLLAPNTPVETAPASFGTDLVEPAVADPRLQSYLVRHYQATGTAGSSSFVPYVLLAAPQRETPVQPVGQNR